MSRTGRPIPAPHARSTGPAGRLLTAALLALAASTGPTFAQNGSSTDPYRVWNWKMPGQLYKQLNHLHRAQFDKAAELFDKGFSLVSNHQTRNNPDKRRQAVGYFKAAALEWQKIRVQLGDVLSDPSLAYVIFMQAHSQFYALNRNQAIRTYTEVLDYFPNEIWIVVPALFFRAEAHFANGDELAGYKSLQAIAADDDYLRHPLAAGALRRLADNFWANRQFDQAASYWLKAWDSYHKSNPGEAANAARRLVACYLVRQQFDRLERFIDRRAEQAASRRRQADRLDGLLSAFQMARTSLGRAQQGWEAWYYRRFHNESQARQLADQHRQAIYDWFAAKQQAFALAGRLWEFRMALLAYAMTHRTADPAPLVKQLIEQLKAMKLPAEQTLENGTSLMSLLLEHRSSEQLANVFGFLSATLRSAKLDADRKQALAGRLIDRLTYWRLFTEARSLLDLYLDATKALWAEYLIAERSGDWKQALEVLEKIQTVGQPNDLRAAREKQAWIYHHQTHQYDKAIEVYRKLADPPRTLWAIQDCQRAAGQTPQALTTLTEIASLFPDQAPRAVFTKAEYYRQDGQHKLAVALYRQILQRFKKSPQSSQAHQRLEEYGIKTGGGLTSDLD